MYNTHRTSRSLTLTYIRWRTDVQYMHGGGISSTTVAASSPSSSSSFTTATITFNKLSSVDGNDDEPEVDGFCIQLLLFSPKTCRRSSSYPGKIPRGSDDSKIYYACLYDFETRTQRSPTYQPLSDTLPVRQRHNQETKKNEPISSLNGIAWEGTPSTSFCHEGYQCHHETYRVAILIWLIWVFGVILGNILEVVINRLSNDCH